MRLRVSVPPWSIRLVPSLFPSSFFAYHTAMDDSSTPSAKGNKPAPTTTFTSVKETIESILIAFILAFVFRAFVVEAFVIPTGSMAPTLLGAHMRFTCPDCGYRFDVNYSSRQDGDEIDIPRTSSRTYAAFCPNCGYKIPRTLATNSPVHYGDRILVLKYLYLLQPAQRWDVVVFKSPADDPKYGQNYIKRLVGKPDETIMVLDGDIYVGHGAHPTDWQVQTKPHAVQNALWRVIADGDFYPQGLNRDSDSIIDSGSGDRWQQPWVPLPNSIGWDLGNAPTNGRVFTFDNLTGSARLNFNPDANLAKHAFTDWLAYDQDPDSPGRLAYRMSEPQSVVSDLKLALTYQRTAGQGPLRLQLSKRNDTFTAEIAPDKVTLLRRSGSGPDMVLASKPHHFSPDSARIVFTNVDYQVTLRIDGLDVLQTTPQQYHPDIPKLLAEYDSETLPPLPSVCIVGQQQTCRISHLSLWRDVYYSRKTANREPAYWGTPDRPMVLGPEEYFVLGDNSPISGDARFWRHDINLPAENLFVEAGRVPDRFLLGKAFFVYWPAGFRPLSDTGPSLVPNFGDMRFIH